MKLFLLAFFFLTSCTQQFHFYKQDGTEREFRADVYECERDTRMAAGSFTRPRVPDSQRGYTYDAYGTLRRQPPSPFASIGNLAATLGEKKDSDNFYVRCMEARGYEYSKGSF